MADTPDFSKIWGSNGNVTYKFTDDNYLTGWSFVGDTPPARGMFDKFFMGTDTKLKYLYDRLNAEIDKTYTVDDTKAPTSNTEQLLATLSELAHMIKTAGGTSDWKTTPATNLATVATLVSNLASGSDVTWDGKKFTNSKLGITGLMDTNGYIAFGPNFGGLIIQWGVIPSMKNGPITEICPLNFDEALFSVAEIVSNKVNPGINGIANAPAIYTYPQSPSNITVVFDVYNESEVQVKIQANWLLICR